MAWLCKPDCTASYEHTPYCLKLWYPAVGCCALLRLSSPRWWGFLLCLAPSTGFGGGGDKPKNKIKLQKQWKRKEITDCKNKWKRKEKKLISLKMETVNWWSLSPIQQQFGVRCRRKLYSLQTAHRCEAAIGWDVLRRALLLLNSSALVCSAYSVQGRIPRCFSSS